MAKQKEYKVGIYARLSKEDSRSGESVSIENQKLMLEKHVNEMRWELKRIYQDDGFSGTNQNRPAFQRMLADVKDGYINTILIKDLSRLGRNYLEVGNLAEVFLPEHGCELISLSEKLDDMMVFRNWFNEQHSKTTSVKVRAARRVCAESGKFLGAYAPYGYKKSPENRHKLVVDEITAPVVRSLFEMRVAGMGFRAIAMKLNDDGIIPPREYYYRGKGVRNPRKTNCVWSETTVQDIIRNEAYIGNIVQGKAGTVSFKNHRQKAKPQEEWIKAQGTHEPLIALELWERAQSFTHRNYRPRRRNDGGTNLFAGLLYCADCGFKLRGQVERTLRKDGSEYKNVSYMCGTYARSGKDACTIHGVNEKALSSLVLEHIRAHAKLIEYDEERILKAVVAAERDNAATYDSVCQSELEAHRKQTQKLELLIESLYEDKVNGIVPESMFARQIQKYERERAEHQQAANALERRIQSMKRDAGNAASWTKLMKRCADIETLDKETLLLLIDKIVVGEARFVDGKRVCDVKIMYNYVGDVDKLRLKPKGTACGSGIVNGSEVI